MLDKRTDRLLTCLARICADGTYKVVEITDLTKCLRPRYHADAVTLGQILKFLKDNEMIDIKYKDDNVYCISVLPRGRAHVESANKKNYYNVTLGRRLAIFTVIGCFIAGFAGALLAGLIIGWVL